uniref:Transmembrane protein n=1 Tax=Panagrolaimus superbus TaxID=310955 RepID=A0A914YX58_9BILA
MNFYFLMAWIPIVINYANEITSNDDQVPSIMSISQFVLTLTFDTPITDERKLYSDLQIIADNVQYNMTLGSMILNGSKTFTFSEDSQIDETILNPFETIIINSLFVFEYYRLQNVDVVIQPLVSITPYNYSADTWISVTQSGENILPHILWNVTFQYKKSCQNQNYGFHCNNQIDSTSTSATATSTTSSSLTYTDFSSTSPISDCLQQIHDLESQKNDEKRLKNLFLWLMIGLFVLSVILLILMILFCCCWLRNRGRVAQYAEEHSNQRRVRRDRVDIVHPHVYPEDQRVEHNVTVRQRTLPPYRPPQPQQHQQQQKSNQGPIDASSNVVFPRTQHSRQQPSRPFQYPSDDDDWSIPPNEHVV